MDGKNQGFLMIFWPEKIIKLKSELWSGAGDVVSNKTSSKKRVQKQLTRRANILDHCRFDSVEKTAFRRDRKSSLKKKRR
jgi:hypothetical protein